MENLGLFQEEGQVIELDATLIQSQQSLFKIIVRDGISIDVLGTEKILPKEILGNYCLVDSNLFLWEDSLSHSPTLKTLDQKLKETV